MYYGVTPLIPIPKDSDKGKVIVSKKGYVYLQVGYSWDPQKRQPHYDRKTIGRTDEKQPNLMYYSPEYEKIFGTVDTEIEEIRKRIDGLHLRKAGKTNAYISFGPFVAVQTACEKVGCLSPLRRIFSSSWKFILGLCVHAIVAENTTAQAFPGWCFTNYCGMSRVAADTEISRLYKDISSRSGDIDVFFTLFWKEYRKRFPNTDHLVVGFDSTNQNYYGRGIPLAKAGHAKINVGTPIINTAMFVDEGTGIPLWYEHYDGSLLDKNQTPFSLKKVVNAGYSKLFIVFDRGYYSEEDVVEIEQLKEIDFGVLCPDGTNWVEDLIRKQGSDIKDQQKHYIIDENVYGNIYEVQPFKENENDKTYYAYLFYDSSRADDERKTIHEVFRYNWNRANERKRYSEKMAAEFAKQAIIVTKLDKTDDEGRNFQLLEDTQMIQSLLDMKGFFVMLSPSKMLPTEAIKIIRKRDMSEKSFAIMMNHFGLRTTYRHSYETYDGLMFVAFIALICLSAFCYYEKSVLHKTTSTSVATIFSELTKYQIRKNMDGKTWCPSFAMSKDQKTIFEKLGLKEIDVQSKVADVKIKN